MSSKTMKLLIIFNFIGFIFFCLAPFTTPYFPQTQEYSLSTSFTLEEATVVEQAIAHFEERVPCVDFINVGDPPGTEKTNGIQILDINPVYELEGNLVGQYQPSIHTILIARTNSKEVPGTEMTTFSVLSGDYKFKITLHELAHALGMSGHPHPMQEDDITHLAASISHKSSKYLSNEDTLYLRKMICNK